MPLAIERRRPIGALVVGRAGMDLYPTPDGAKIENAHHLDAEIGGSGANIAVALARQGASVALLSAISEDAVGRFVGSRLKAYGVDMSSCRYVYGQYRTSLALAETRTNDAEVVIYRNGAADLQFQHEDLERAQLDRASVLIVTGTALATQPSRGAVLTLLELAKDTGTFSILDVDHRRYSWLSDAEAKRCYLAAGSLCNAIVGNDEEFEIIAGRRRSAFGAATELVERGAAFVILKKGSAGSICLTPEGEFETGIFHTAVQKPFGAGDAFMGGVVAGLLEGRSLQESVRRGTAAAALVVSRRGCASAMPTPVEIDALIAAS